MDLDLALISIFLLAIAFWLLDWLWKKFQRNYYNRLDEIEAILKTKLDISPRISASWRMTACDYSGDEELNWWAFEFWKRVLSAKKKKEKRFEFITLLWPQVFIPHLPIAFISLVALGVACLSAQKAHEPSTLEISIKSHAFGSPP